MEVVKLDGISIRLKEYHDFSWLKKYGKAFWCVDETGSGCIGIGMEDREKKYFCKIAGVNTMEAEVNPRESVEILKQAVSLYHDLKHPNLVKVIEAYAYGPFYVVVFSWLSGQCLFDHWNFETYKANSALISPKEKFRKLPACKKIAVVNVLFSFLELVHKKGYVAVDFYDGSILYDFITNETMLCDIDLFRKKPVVNDMGADWYGTKRLKAPEEYEKGSPIDEQTNIFTLGALLFEFFGNYTDDEVKQRYAQNRFVPCSRSEWQLNEESYQTAVKAVCADRNGRYKTFGEFYEEWSRSFL